MTRPLALLLLALGGCASLSPTALELPAGCAVTGETALMRAAAQGHQAEAEGLIARGADPAAATSEGWTALHAAAGQGHTLLARMLVARGGAPEARFCGGWTPLALAVRGGHPGAVHDLALAGASLTPPPGALPLLLEASRHDLSLVRALLKAGAPLDERDAAGHTALWHARQSGHDEIARFLQGRGLTEEVPPHG